MSDLLSMDQILAVPASPSTPWPHAPAQPGQVYGFTCPSHGTDMVAMSMQTFLGFGTDMERMRRAGAELDKKLKDTVAELVDLQARHQNLREATRKERLAKLEDRIVVDTGRGPVRIKHRR